MLHAIKPMIWQALQTLKEPKEAEDVVKRSQLQVLSHNLSADGNLPQLLKPFDSYFKEEEVKIDCKKYLETFIHDAVLSLEKGNKEKEIKICVERVHQVCWELCKVQVTASNSGRFPTLLTEASTKTWWKVFNTFAERDSDTDKTLYPVVMDWEEVDYWVNVTLKVMGLPTIAPQRQERQVMGSTLLTFQEALLRFNARLNENNGMYVRDSTGKPDVVYIEQALSELNIRLFEGIYLSGTLTKIKKGHSSAKWCVLYQLGLAFADSPADVDKSDSKSFIPIGSDTQLEHLTDKSGRPIRFQLKNPKDSLPLVFEANNISTRNKWLTAIICMKHNQTPNYEQDSRNRRRNRRQNRQYELEMKRALQEQKEKTKEKEEEFKEMMREEQERFKDEADRLRNASKEELHAKISDYEGKLQSLMQQMQSLSESHQQEKQTILEQHEVERDRLRRQLGNDIVMVQSEMEAEIRAKSRQLEEMQEFQEKLEKEHNDLKGELQRERELWEEKVRQLETRLAEVQQQREEAEAERKQLQEGRVADRAELEYRLQQLGSSSSAALEEKQRRIEEAEAEAAKLAEQLRVAQQQGQQQLQEAQQQEQRQKALVEEADAKLDEQLRANARLQDESQQLQARSRELEEAASSAGSQLRDLQHQLQQLQDQRQKWENDCVMLPELRRMLDEESTNRSKLEEENETMKEELKAKNILLQERSKDLTLTISAKDSLQKRLDEATAQQKFQGHHRGPGFDAVNKN